MKEIGKIISIKNNIAIVKMEKSSNCHGCCSACKTSNNETTLEVLNSLNAKQGDIVKILIPGKTAWTASIIVYIIPIIMMFLGYFIGIFLFDNKEIYGIISSILFLIFALFIVKKFDTKFLADKNLLPRIVEIVKD